jgi:hypothetical protein
MRDNGYLFNNKVKSSSNLDRPDSYQEVVRKQRVKTDNLRLYMNIIETRPTKGSKLADLEKDHLKMSGFKRNFGSKVSNSERYAQRALNDVNKKRGC